MRLRASLLSGTALLVLPLAASGSPLFTENFDVDPTANWTVNNGPGSGSADFFFDYSAVGIPSAPNSGGSTRGLKLQANLTGGVFSGLSASPNGLNLTGEYRVQFDLWANFNGPFPGGGNGSTNLSTFGVGTGGASAQWPGGTQDSVWFGATGDGGSASDYRAYSTAAPTSYASGNPVYAAPGGAINNTNAYYASLGGVSAPAAQTTLFPQQSGVTNVGSAGMAWHDVTIDVTATQVIWAINGLRIAAVDLSTVTLGGGNIFFGHSDINGTSSTDPNAPALLFTLIDNVRVVPEPSTLAVLGAAGAMLGLRRRK